MDEEDSRVATGVLCLQCGAEIVERRVRDGDGLDHWYECPACGCSCVSCRRPMTYQDKDTSSGIEYRSYRCAGCSAGGVVRAGVAMWKAYEAWNAERDREAPPAGSIPRWLTYDDVDGSKVVRLTHGEWLIGRDPECSIVIRDFGCSRRHAKLVVDADGVQIVDVKSKGGTQVNRRSVVEARLQSGDAILLGTMPFRFVEGAEPARRPEPPAPRRDAAGRPPRPGLATLTAALERAPGSLREETSLGELGRDIYALMYVVRRVCAAFKVELPQDRLIQINTVGELLDLVEQAGGTVSEPR